MLLPTKIVKTFDSRDIIILKKLRSNNKIIRKNTLYFIFCINSLKIHKDTEKLDIKMNGIINSLLEKRFDF